MDSAGFFYTYGVWEAVQTENTDSFRAVEGNAGSNEAVYRAGNVSVGTSPESRVTYVRAELDAKETGSVNTMVAICAALSGNTEPTSGNILQYIGFLGEAAAADGTNPAKIGDYAVSLNSDGSVIHFSALLDGEKADGQEQNIKPLSGNEGAPDAGKENTETAVRVATGKGKLRLRAKASSKSKILAEMPDGAEVTLLEQGEEWCRIQYNNQTGYAMTKYLSIPDETGQAGT